VHDLEVDQRVLAGGVADHPHLLTLLQVSQLLADRVGGRLLDDLVADGEGRAGQIDVVNLERHLVRVGDQKDGGVAGMSLRMYITPWRRAPSASDLFTTWLGLEARRRGPPPAEPLGHRVDSLGDPLAVLDLGVEPDLLARLQGRELEGAGRRRSCGRRRG
jgi:hypothetical protein